MRDGRERSPSIAGKTLRLAIVAVGASRTVACRTKKGRTSNVKIALGSSQGCVKWHRKPVNEVWGGTRWHSSETGWDDKLNFKSWHDTPACDCCGWTPEISTMEFVESLPLEAQHHYRLVLDETCKDSIDQGVAGMNVADWNVRDWS